MTVNARQYLDFDRFRIDADNRQLFKDGEPLALHAKDFDVLLVLAQHAGRNLTKQEILDAAWPETFVEEGNLNRHVSTLRRVLGDDPQQQRYIKTLPRLGYRFTADVRSVAAREFRLAREQVETRRLTITEEEHIVGFWTAWRIAAFAGLLVFAGGVWAWSAAHATRQGGTNGEAVQAYRQGRDLWNDRQPGSLHSATLLLEKAVEIDPEFALAHAALADAYAFDYTYWRKAERQAQKAMEIDPRLGEPHASIGFVRLFWEWDIPGAESEFKRAVGLSPNYATGHQWYALALVAGGHGDAAVVEIETALALSPDSVPINADRCQVLYSVHRYEEAIAQCQKTLKLDPANLSAHDLLFQIYASMGLADAAVDKFIANLAHMNLDQSPVGGTSIADAYRKEGSTGFYRAVIDLYQKQHPPPHFKLAQIYARLGEYDQVMTELEEAYRRREFETVLIDADPIFKPVEYRPEFLELLKGLRR